MPHGYTYYPGFGFYKFHTDKMPWIDAKETCENEGGHLAVINSKLEAKLMKWLLKFHKGIKLAHIGFYDKNTGLKRRFVTVNGKLLLTTAFPLEIYQHLQ